MKKALLAITALMASALMASVAVQADSLPQTEQTPWGVHTETVSGNDDTVYQQAAVACLAALPAGTDTGPHSTALQTCITGTVGGVGDLNGTQQD
jgi:hypothetical protein